MVNKISLFDLIVTDLFDNQRDPKQQKAQVQQLFVDEAGVPTLFQESGKVIVDTFGCSRFFIMGKLEVDDPPNLESALNELRLGMIDNPYFSGISSFKPERQKTAVAFHAKDDLPEVRFSVFNLLRSFGSQLRFYAVVCDKLKILDTETAKREAQPGYCFNENSIYDFLMRELFGKFHRMADRYKVTVAKRGNSTRNEALTSALAAAEKDFEQKFGFRRSQADAWTITVLKSTEHACLQAVDYFLWALQRFYEVKFNPDTKEKLLDKSTGQVIHEDRFLKSIWPQVGEIHDLHFGPNYGTFYNAQKPLLLEDRFPGPKIKKPRV